MGALSKKEAIILLKTWILPTVLLTARSYFLCDIVVRSLKVVFQTTLGVDSWGVTRHELAQEPDCGGDRFPTPKVWLQAQFGLSFHKFLQQPTTFTPSVKESFCMWCLKYGVPLHAWAWPYIQLGPVPYKTFGYLSCSLKSFSIARRYIVDGIADTSARGLLPLWYSAVFKNEKHLTYYCPALIQKGILMVKDLYDDDGRIKPSLLSKIAPTWKQIYETGLGNFLRLQPTDPPPRLGRSLG